MFDVLLSVAISFTITFLAIPAVINVAEMKKLFDMPDARKCIISLSPPSADWVFSPASSSVAF
jgi:hypothetical protein